MAMSTLFIMFYHNAPNIKHINKKHDSCF